MMNRRDFMKGGAMASALGAGAMLGTTAAVAEEAKAFDVVETIDTDTVIVGAGIAGIAAATQAGQNGDKVVLLE